MNIFSSIGNAYKNFKIGPSAKMIRLEQREEAERELVKHEATLEHVVAMRDMYRSRVDRLNADVS